MTLCFIKSAIASNERTNALTEILFTPALTHAMELDKEFDRTGEIRGPRKVDACSSHSSSCS